MAPGGTPGRVSRSENGLPRRRHAQRVSGRRGPDQTGSTSTPQQRTKSAVCRPGSALAAGVTIAAPVTGCFRDTPGAAEGTEVVPEATAGGFLRRALGAGSAWPGPAAAPSDAVRFVPMIECRFPPPLNRLQNGDPLPRLLSIPPSEPSRQLAPFCRGVTPAGGTPGKENPHREESIPKIYCDDLYTSCRIAPRSLALDN